MSLLSKADKAAAEKRRWWKELELAGKREKTWFDKADKVVKRYRGEEKKKNRFNVLWSNTETLRPAIYNSRPNPDVRRRFRDADPVGKAVSELLERALMVMVDYECTDQSFKNDCLDGLLVGRGVSRIRYIPSLRQIGEAPKVPGETKPDPESTDGLADSEPQEEVEYEQVVPEHVDWKDIRFGYARTWDEMPHLFFRHKLSRPEGEKQFGATVLKNVKFAVPTSEDKNKGEEQNETEKVAEFWECWDKTGKQVFFLQEQCDELLFPVDNPDGSPPLALAGFFPIPDPLRLVENTGSFEAIIPFTLYEEQADQLDQISGRINKIVAAMRLRGVYDAKLSSDLSAVMANDDNELTPIQSAQGYIDSGGLEKAIAWFPTEKSAELLTSLYEARDRQKAIIDELTGISDIVRGATDPDETRGAQELKQTNYSVRLSRMQKEVQRYCKDLLRLASEVMAEKFAPETFTQMTELQFPTNQQKMEAQAQQPPPVPGQPPPPPNPMLQMPSWEDIKAVMTSDGLRRFKVDVETDSTIAATLNSDLAGIAQVLEAIGKLMEMLQPMVMSGSLPIDAAKEIIMATVRRAKMGMAVEDAFDKMKPPQPPGPPVEVQVAQIKAQTDEKNIQAKAQADIAKTQADQQAQTQNRQAELQMEAQKAQLDASTEVQKNAQLLQHEFALKSAEAQEKTKQLAMQLENERLITDANNSTKVMIAELDAQVKREVADKQAETAKHVAKNKPKPGNGASANA